MADEKEVTIRIVGKNLSAEELEKVQKQLFGVRDAARRTQDDGVQPLGGSFAKLVASFGAANLISKAAESLYGFGKAAIEGAGHLVDLNAKTSISLEELQRMAYVAGQTGTTVDAFADVVFKMGINIAKGSDETRAAVAKLGITFEQFKAMTPEEQFRFLVANMDKLGPTAERNAGMVAIAGKGVGDAIAGMSDDYARLAGQAHVSSDELVRGVDEFGDAVDDLKSKISTGLVNIVGAAWLGWKEIFAKMGEGMDTVAAHLSGQESDLERKARELEAATKRVHLSAAEFAAIMAPTEGVITSTKTATTGLTQELEAARQKMRDFTAEQQANIKAGLDLGKSTKEISDATGLAAAAIELYKNKLQDEKTAHNKSEEATKKHANALKALASIQKPLTDATKEYVLYQVEQGAKTADLAEELGVQVEQIEKVIDAQKRRTDSDKAEAAAADALREQFRKWMADQVKQAEDSTRGVAANFIKIQDIARETANVRAQASLTAAQLEVKAINDWADEQKRAFVGTLEQAKQYYAAIDALAVAKLNATDKPVQVNPLIGLIENQGKFSVGELQATLAGAAGFFQQLSQISGDATATVARNIGAIVSLAAQGAKALSNTATSLSSVMSAATFVIGAYVTAYNMISAHYDAINQRLHNFIENANSLRAQIAALGQGADPYGGNELPDQKERQDQIILGLQRQLAALQANIDKVKAERAAFQDAESAIDDALKITAQAYSDRQAAYTVLGDLQRQYADATDDAEKTKIQQSIDATNALIANRSTLIKAVGIESAAQADALASVELAGLVAKTKAGETLMQALKEERDSVIALKVAVEDAGVDGGAAFQHLFGMVALASDDIAGPALTALEDYTKSVEGLRDAGVLTEAMYGALESKIGQTVTTLEGEGKTHDQVMEAIQHDLQVAWELQDKYHYKLDETTQALVDEAVANGQVGEAHKTTADQMLDMTSRIVTAIEGLANLFGVKLAGDIDFAADKATKLNDNLRRVPTDINIGVRYDDHAVQRESDADSKSTPGFATGGIATGRMVAHLAERGKKEIIGDVDFMSQAIEGAFARMGPAAAGAPGGGSGPSTVVLQIAIDGKPTRTQTIELVRGAMARHEIPVPQTAVKATVSYQ